MFTMHREMLATFFSHNSMHGYITERLKGYSSKETVTVVLNFEHLTTGFLELLTKLCVLKFSNMRVGTALGMRERMCHSTSARFSGDVDPLI
jgi:hypothetical protein